MFFILGFFTFLSAGGNFYMAFELSQLFGLADFNSPHSKTSQDMTQDSKMLHVVTTRFMQNQPNLLALGKARLRLFETFCLPTVIHQETSEFMWFIMTDPNLHPNLFSRLKSLLEPYSNFYLVSSNTKLLTPGNLTQGIEAARTIIHTGDLEQLYSKMFDQHRPLLIETRLDADDGLHKTVLSEIQRLAYELPKDVRGWQIICNRLHFEWRNNEILEETNHTIQSSGKLRLVREHICTTPGYSLIKHRIAQSIEFPPWPKIGHHLITREWPNCQSEGGENVTHDCWLKLDPYPAAIRSRTITSAGMSRVEPMPDGTMYENQTELFWRVIEKDFGISRHAAVDTSQFLKDNLADIALDNLKGQCTFGHSCKNSSREILLGYVNSTVMVNL
ncbi:putative rhamnosyl transferase [Nitzschia inconspicua]|uniref:Rhamnosyl transferase n=1 Tax=Nitzschia inconspicua TaxID=303405 RepID=A0A9K3K5F6_9STRA|nr:putative rhamnosyl transferase [Nitzschia inconspicua]KAG7367474.1 putative rhamnosyl transferase [Nitzschia inconspicua]